MATGEKSPAFVSANRRKWEYSNGLYRKHLELYLDRMYRYLKLSGAERVLDAGCGEGIVYRAMRVRGFRGSWCGFDFSHEAVEFSRHASPEVEWRQASAYAIPFADESFDLVLSSQVLEHLADPVAAMKEYARVSRKWILLSVPIEPYFRALTWLSVHLHIGGDPGHVNFWTGRDFREFCSVRLTGSEWAIRNWERTTVYQIALVEKAKANRGVGGLQQHG